MARIRAVRASEDTTTKNRSSSLRDITFRSASRSAISEGRAIWASSSGRAALGYLAAITAAELMTALADVRLGVLMHALILATLLLRAGFVASSGARELSLALSLAPLV